MHAHLFLHTSRFHHPMWASRLFSNRQVRDAGHKFPELLSLGEVL
jgi:hypothetical protein